MLGQGGYPNQGQMDPLHAQLLLTPPSFALILSQACNVHVLVFVITAAPLVTNPMGGK